MHASYSPAWSMSELLNVSGGGVSTRLCDQACKFTAYEMVVKLIVYTAHEIYII